MANAFIETEVCMFVGGIGTKAGVSNAGGCTKDWLLAKNGDPSSLFGADGAPLFVDNGTGLFVETSGEIISMPGAFSNIEAGMIAFVDFDSDNGYYVIDAVSGTGDSITLRGWTWGTDQEIFQIIIGGAFSSLAAVMPKAYASYNNCYILTNKDETLTNRLDIRYPGSAMKNYFKHIIGYNTTMGAVNGQLVSDMDFGGAHYQGAADVLKVGVTAGCKVVLDGSGLASEAVIWQIDNLKVRNLHIKAAGGQDVFKAVVLGDPLLTGADFAGLVLEGGVNGINTNSIVDGVRISDCIALNQTGYGYAVFDTNEKFTAVLNGCIADGCATGFGLTQGILSGCIGNNVTVGAETIKSSVVSGCVFYDCGSAAFVCDGMGAYWQVINTIVVLNVNANGVFHVKSGGGSVVFEHYNCFVDTEGNTVTYHYNADWPLGYSDNGIGAHSLQTEPLMTDAANGDLTLSAGSPCIDAGMPDAFGNATHIGFYQSPESTGGGGGNVQANRNRQYGVGRNKQYD